MPAGPVRNGLIIILFVLLVLVAIGNDRTPRAAIQDTTVAMTRTDYRRCITIRTPRPDLPPKAIA